jgi:predicted XRE-type DNA-binding protein
MAAKQPVSPGVAPGVDVSTDGLDLGPSELWATAPRFQQSKFFAEFLNRLVTGRDMNVIITAGGETGVGKTTLAAALAMMMDQHGWTFDKAAVADPIKYDKKYDEVPPGSVLILDEAEKAADARQGQRKEIVELTQSFATKRYKQVFSILTAPSKSWIDKRLGADSADYWIQCQQTDLGRIKGKATVYRLKENEHGNENYAKFIEFIEWPNLDWDKEYQRLDERKEELLESDEETHSWVHRDEFEEKMERATREAKREKRNEMIRELYRSPDISQTMIADAAGISQSQVSKIANQ